MALDISILKTNKEEILKAEIASLFTLLNKTFAQWWKKKGYLQNCQTHNTINNIDNEIESVLSGFKNIEVELMVNNSLIVKYRVWDDFLKNWRGWRKINLIKNPEKFLKVLYGGCEGINSGIEKGSPKNQMNGDKPFLTTAFGTFKNFIDCNDLEHNRDILFNDVKTANKVFGKSFTNSITELINKLNGFNKYKELDIRENIFKLVNLLYYYIPSDTRFPANDTSLFDQSYMATSLFKATLSGILLSFNKQSGIDLTNFDNSKIKWSILGIQYDKLGLAEKGLKPGSIDWYRNVSVEVDDKIKELIEVDYPLGNEVYRDETGIYFVVSEKLIDNTKIEGDFYKLNQGLNEVKEKILKVFRDKFDGEVYPSILLTKPSRGIMNLGHLVEKSEENFLKAEIPDDFDAYLKRKDDAYPNGLCQVCGMRLARREGNKDSLICDVCEKRKEGRVEEWLDNIKGETIWTGELQDKNGKIALVTLKFELNKWINGDLINSLLIRNEDYFKLTKIINSIFKNLSLLKDFNTILNFYNSNKTAINEFLQLFDRNGIQVPFNSILKDKDLKKILLQPDSNLGEKKKLKDLFWRAVENAFVLLSDNNKNKGKGNSVTITIKDFNDFLKTFNPSPKPNFNSSEKRYKNKYFVDSNIGCFKDIFSVGFICLQVKNVMLERSIGSQWEKFISNKVGYCHKNNHKKIDFDKQTIDWQCLEDADIEFLSELFLQFLLRKNPSPARLRRVWETTKEFFEYLEKELLNIAEIPENRCKRLVWKKGNYQKGNLTDDGEYVDGDIAFWAKDNDIYLITSIDKVVNKKEFTLKKYDEKNVEQEDPCTLKIENATEEDYKPYFSVISPTPVSWQFIIPAENVPDLIKNIQKEYYKNFRWVYGKLPLHIGVVIQNYKKPLYIGIKALRKIRRDGQEWQSLGEEISAKDFKEKRNEALKWRQLPEKVSDCESFYSLFEKTSGSGKYEFYLYPDSKRSNKQILDIIRNSSDTDKFYFYPNTFDFEFLDTNTRRNDILYNNSKRLLDMKANRPYNLEDWQLFENFKKYFDRKKSSSKLQKLVSLIYSKISDWDDEESLKKFMISAFVNVLDLKSEEQKNSFAKVFVANKANEFDELKKTDAPLFKKKLLKFIDMFEFWHTAIKEV